MARAPVLPVLFLLSLVALLSPVGAQRSARVARVGFLANGAPSAPATFDAFRDGLRDLGRREGPDLVLEVRWAEGRLERLPALARELAESKVDVLVTAGYQGIQAVKEVAGSIPVVMVACDPAENIVASLARPGGRITGVTCMSADLTPKRLQLLKEALPKARRVAVLYNPVDPNKAGEVGQMGMPARSLGLTLQPVEARDPGDFERVFAELARSRPDALFVLPDTLTIFNRKQIAALATRHGLPAMYGFREFVEDGGLMSYGTSMRSLFRRAAAHVDRILNGARPGDLPVEQATTFELVINLSTAKALRLTIPQSLRLRADEVIQ